ncbi:MAG TPA: hypothetical protein VKQ09_05850 [Sphingomonas sp.]|nr:hypothetical protein [Sphingomonas sp.]
MKAVWTCREDIILRESIGVGVSLARICVRLPGRNMKAIRHRAERLGLQVPA